MVNSHSRYPYTGEFCVSFTSYFQNMENWLAGQRLVSGCAVTRASSSSVTVASGSYVASGVTYTYAGATLTGITSCSSSNHRYDMIYLDTADGTAKVVTGTQGVPLLPDSSDGITYFLENKVPQPGNMPSETSILIAVICVTSSGIRSGNNGTYSTAGCADMRFIAPGTVFEVASQTRGDLITRGASTWQRLAIGTNKQYLTTNGTDPSWSNLNIPDLYVSTQARGDLIMRGASAWGGLSAGATGKFLMANGAAADLTWSFIPFTSLYDAAQVRGDLLVRGSSAWQRLGTGTINQVLTSGGSGADLSWTSLNKNRELIMPFNNGQTAFTAGILTYIPLNLGSAMTLTGIEMLAAPSGSIAIDIWKCTYANYDVTTHPVVGDKITSSTPPTISSGVKVTDNTLTGWTTAFATDDVIAINVNSCTSITQFTLALKFVLP